MQQKNDVLVLGSGNAGKLMARTAKEGRRTGVVERK
jgi:pyruvate/2-oxoglutarate dehydrogenase complex dihydrolipoamide dehydrogenase (E3) component